MTPRFRTLIPLVIFSSAVIVAVGMVLGVTGHAVSVGLGRCESCAALLVIALGFTVGGMFVSLLHLGHPLRSWQVIRGIGHSWISLEIALVSGLAILLSGAIVVLRGGDDTSVGTMLLFCASAAGVALMFALAKVYALKPFISWRPWPVQITPLANALLMAAVVYLMLDTAASSKATPLFLYGAIGLDALIAMWRFFHFRHGVNKEAAWVFKKLRPMVVLLYPIHGALLVSVLACTPKYETAAAILVGIAIALQRLGFYASAVKPTPRTEMARLKAERMTAAIQPYPQ
ncbi:MAG: dimethyl sulfoxide reductase anchor subunit [Myxococcota bacterium]|nr:dimethyl sulfoxide reductase anchor subunit [Myxococcota bacterium]